MLPHGTDSDILAFMHLYSIFYLQLFLSILFYNLSNLVLKHQTETVDGTSISQLCLPFFMRVMPKGLTFGLCLHVLLLYVMCMLCIVFNV